MVKKEHVEYACKFIDKIYSKEACGYDLYAKRRAKEISLRNENEIIQHIVTQGRDFTECLSDAKQLVSFLVKNRAIKRKHQFYLKTPAFIQLLKKILDNPDAHFIESKDREKEL